MPSADDERTPPSGDRDEHLEGIVARFEQAWHDGARPTIEDFLDEELDERGAILVELVHAEMELRLKEGEAARVEEYLTRYPDLAQNDETVLELIGAEYAVRCRRDKSTSAAEYLERFSQYEKELTDRLTEQPPPPRRERFPIRLNCPHCQNPIAIVDDAAEDDVVCPSCGSSFRLDQDRTVSWRPEKLPQLGKFELLEAVGRGAFGTVYRARDTELDRIVAVKVPRSGTFANQEDEDRFIREARSVAQLKHSGVVPIYEVGHSESFPYIVAQYVDGVALSDALTGRRFGFRESAEIIAQIAEALEHSHKQGVVHRDLKPSNVMLQESDGLHAMLMDFGLARRDEGEITVTLEGQVLGTPAYMSPEQARGESRRVDGRSDVYSLGVILYELLTGELPFRGNSRMLLHQVLHDEPRPPRRLNDRIPRDLETVTLKAMAKERSRRYQSAAELADELRRWLAGQPITARPISTTSRGWRWCKRNPGVAGLTAAVLLSLVAGTAVSAYFATEATDRAAEAEAETDAKEQALRKEEQERKRADDARKHADDALKRAENERNRAETSIDSVVQLLVRKALDLHAQRDVRRAVLVLGRAHAATPKERAHLRHIIESNIACRTSAWCPLNGAILFDSEIARLLISHDGRTLVTFGTRGETRVYDATTGDLLGSPLPRCDRPEIACLSPDGQTLALGLDKRSIQLWDVKVDRPVGEPLRHPQEITCAQFASDSQAFFTAGRDGLVCQWDRQTGQELCAHKQDAAVLSLAVLPDGRRLLASCNDGTLRVWDAGEPEKEPAQLDFHTNAQDPPKTTDHNVLSSSGPDRLVLYRCSPSGEEVLVRSWGWGDASALDDLPGLFRSLRNDHYRLYVDRNGWRLVRYFDLLVRDGIPLPPPKRGDSLPDSSVPSVSVSDDGRVALLVNSVSRTAEVIDVSKMEVVFRVASSTRPTVSEWPAALVSSDILVTVKENQAYLWDVRNHAPLAPPIVHQAEIKRLAVSADGTIVTVDEDGTVGCWEGSTGLPLYPLIRSEMGIADTVFSSDGTTIVTAGSDNIARVWRPRPKYNEPYSASVADFISDWVSGLTMVRMEDNGFVQPSHDWSLPCANAELRLLALELGKDVPRNLAQPVLLCSPQGGVFCKEASGAPPPGDARKDPTIRIFTEKVREIERIYTGLLSKQGFPGAESALLYRVAIELARARSQLSWARVAFGAFSSDLGGGWFDAWAREHVLFYPRSTLSSPEWSSFLLPRRSGIELVQVSHDGKRRSFLVDSCQSEEAKTFDIDVATDKDRASSCHSPIASLATYIRNLERAQVKHDKVVSEYELHLIASDQFPVEIAIARAVWAMHERNHPAALSHLLEAIEKSISQGERMRTAQEEAHVVYVLQYMRWIVQLSHLRLAYLRLGGSPEVLFPDS